MAYAVPDKARYAAGPAVFAGNGAVAGACGVAGVGCQCGCAAVYAAYTSGGIGAGILIACGKRALYIKPWLVASGNRGPRPGAKGTAGVYTCGGVGRMATGDEQSLISALVTHVTLTAGCIK